MSAAYEELVELLDERGIGYWASDGQAVRLDLRGEVVSVAVSGWASFAVAGRRCQEGV